MLSSCVSGAANAVRLLLATIFSLLPDTFNLTSHGWTLDGRMDRQNTAAVPAIRDPGVVRGIGNGVMGGPGVVMWIIGRHAKA